jgi:hypothetical protein
MEFIKLEFDPDGELYTTSCRNENYLMGIKEDEDPLLVRYPLAKAENEVSPFFNTKQRLQEIISVRLVGYFFKSIMFKSCFFCNCVPFTAE